MAVAALAREEVATIAPDASVDDVVGVMIEDGVGSVVVVEGGQPLGIITDRDVVIRVHGQGEAPADVVARDIMSQDLESIAPDEGLYELIRTMGEAGVRRMPVVEDGQLVGIVTLDDVLILLGMELNAISNLIRSESPPFEVAPSDVYDE
jgi:CBS domain-containing protein